MKTEPTIQELREAAKNHPNTFLAGALYVVDLYASQPMSAEQVHGLAEKYASGYYEKDDYEYNSLTDLCIWEKLVRAFKAGAALSTAPTVKAEGWVSVEDKLPEVLETVWVSNGKGWTALGCRTDYYENDEGGFDWCWAGSNGIIYEESGKIVSECEEDDLDVRFWHPLPEPPATK